MEDKKISSTLRPRMENLSIYKLSYRVDEALSLVLNCVHCSSGKYRSNEAVTKKIVLKQVSPSTLNLAKEYVTRISHKKFRGPIFVPICYVPFWAAQVVVRYTLTLRH